MRLFYAVCGCAVVFLAVMTARFKGDSADFTGVADSKEIVVNWETSVEIRACRVVPGQKVNAGDTLVELSSHELDLEISQLGHDLDELRNRRVAHATMSRSEVRQLKSLQGERIAELRDAIDNLESQIETNRALISRLRSVKGDSAAGAATDSASPAAVRLSSLKRELARVLDSSYVKVDELNSQLSFSGSPLGDQLSSIEDELRLLREQRGRLFIAAQIDGAIGSVNYRDGEKVAPFAPILTLHSESPSYVRGYIHESVYSRAALGQKVRVRSAADAGQFVTGEIVGVGSRIVEFPIRLRKAPEMQMWGREVSIKIPETNPFLLGEKVLISLPRRPGSGGWWIVGDAFGAAPDVCQYGPENATLIAGVSGTAARLEASGALYLADMDRYLVISDDTDGKRPELCLTSARGVVDRLLTIDGLSAIDDMESIAQDIHGSIFVAASQSCNKKGRRAASRELLVRMRRTADTLMCTGTITLRDSLAALARRAPQARWARYFLAADGACRLDIEAMAWLADTLLLGCKSPAVEGCPAIISIPGAAGLFDGHPLDANAISVLSPVAFIDPVDGSPGRISDMHCHGHTLYVLTRSRQQSSDVRRETGCLWRRTPIDGRPVLVCRFEGLRPEGVAYNTNTGELLVTCDNGKDNPSQVLTLKGVL